MWFREALAGPVGNSLRVDQVIYHDASEHQDLLVFENETYGRVLVLNGIVQVTTADEFIYHEMMAHVPLLAHGQAKKVLIIGGGDGGVGREVLKHKGVEKLTLVEIDADVVKFSKEWLPTVSDGAFEDPRFEVIITDGVEFMRDSQEHFDVIIVDSTDPVGPGEVLFTREFYTDCQKRLNPGGILVTQNGAPFLQPQELTNSYRSFDLLFKHATFYAITVPTYPGGVMTLGFATDNTEALSIDVETLKTRFEALNTPTRYYTPELHKGAFQLPAYVRACMTPE
ncbi:polyamine aminopropyltransferase [Woodsholea maritima]|uniref:polyamine aminopropyltransferase n=1 Tax=Woodsholea maritima TaxID=240237 RepID=UPI000380FC3E